MIFFLMIKGAWGSQIRIIIINIIKQTKVQGKKYRQTEDYLNRCSAPSTTPVLPHGLVLRNKGHSLRQGPQDSSQLIFPRGPIQLTRSNSDPVHTADD